MIIKPKNGDCYFPYNECHYDIYEFAIIDDDNLVVLIMGWNYNFSQIKDEVQYLRIFRLNDSEGRYREVRGCQTRLPFYYAKKLIHSQLSDSTYLFYIWSDRDGVVIYQLDQNTNIITKIYECLDSKAFQVNAQIFVVEQGQLMRINFEKSLSIIIKEKILENVHDMNHIQYEKKNILEIKRCNNTIEYFLIPILIEMRFHKRLFERIENFFSSSPEKGKQCKKYTIHRQNLNKSIIKADAKDYSYEQNINVNRFWIGNSRVIILRPQIKTIRQIKSKANKYSRYFVKPKYAFCQAVSEECPEQEYFASEWTHVIYDITTASVTQILSYVQEPEVKWIWDSNFDLQSKFDEDQPYI